MFHLKLCATALVLAAIPIASRGQYSPANRPWPPGVQKVSDESPALSPEESLKTFFMPPGYRVELVASEPLVRDPIAIDWDTRGRLWVVEMPAYVRNLDLPEPNLDPICRIVVLEDTDHDGRMDKRTVFADGMVLPRAVKVLDQGVLVAEPPYIWLMHDRDGDLRMHTKEMITDKYGRREASVEKNANSLNWSLDNWIYTAECDIYLRLKNGKFEVRKTLSRGEWGVTHDDAGRVFRNTNESPLHVDFVPTPYFARNPNLLRTRGSYDRLGDFEEINTVWPVRPNPGTNRAYQAGIDRPDGSIARFTSVCAPVIYRGDRLPAELYGNAFLAEPAANLVSRAILNDDGTTLRVRKAYEKGEFLASTDERFRPVALSNGPDGTLYVVDMYRGIIQERIDITEYLHGQILKRKLDQSIELGRIYRVVHESTQRDETPALVGASSAELVAALSHPNGWRRDRAQQLLVEHNDKSVAPALVKLAHEADNPRTRLHALWTLDGIDAIDQTTVTRALSDASKDVRASAIRLAERWLGDTDSSIQAAVLKRLDDSDWSVRQQLAASLGSLPQGPREKALASLLERHADDPVTLDAALSGLRGSEAVVLEKLVQAADAPNPRRDPALIMLAATIVRSAQDGAVQALFTWIADDRRPEWQRATLLRGAEVALLGATMPGTVVEKRPVLGDRIAGGGNYKFARPVEPAPAARATRAGSNRSLRLNHEPAALSALAAHGDDLGSRAKAVLARVVWPGKPGAPAPIAPLSREEQARYDAGSEIYKNICQACHQPDGRGQDGLAPSLVGSELALAPAEITARILLNGKEGGIGLMPPVGAILTDEKIASVLTYVRREWGQDGSAVDPASVKTVRTLTAGRARPWKNEELLEMLPASRNGK